VSRAGFWVIGRPPQPYELCNFRRNRLCCRVRCRQRWSYAGARRHRLHYRYKGANVAGRLYGVRAREEVTADEADRAAKTGSDLSLNELIDLASVVAS
jgi:hypothetical protein